MSGRPVIAVDVDEVLADFIPTLALFHNEIYGSELSSGSFHSYEFHHVWGGTFEECNVKMLSFFESSHFKEMIPPIEGALEALQRLKDETGAELHIVTSRQHAIADITREWIESHFPGIFKEVHFGNHYSSEGKKRSKPEMCQDIGALVIIDDSQKYAGHCAESGIPCVLFGDYAWNRNDEMAGGAAWASKVDKDTAALVTKVGTDWKLAAETLKRIVVDEYRKKRVPKLPLMAAVQLCATSDKARNMKKLDSLVRQAATFGASFISLPEACLCIGGDRDTRAETLDGQSVAALKALSRELRVYLNVGGVALVPDKEQDGEEKKLRNSALLIDPAGELLCVYDKIHLFDNPYTQMRESDYTVAGDPTQLVTATLSLPDDLQLKLGLTICYDVRFPALFHRLREQNCDVCTVPSAFMQRTGEAHWDVLLRARAIETQMYVVAAAQCGEHNEKRSSYGHSMIISPWGEVLAQLDGTEESWCAASFDPTVVKSTRESIPVMEQQRLK